MNKIVVAITGASGSIYPKILLTKLQSIKDQWSSLGIVITENARLVWKTELGNEVPKFLVDKNENNRRITRPNSPSTG